MHVEKIKYLDFLNNEREEEFMFNLTEAEVTTMQLSTTGGLEAHIRKIMSTQDGPKVVELFKELILASYGEISPDGRRFIKYDPVDHHRLADDFAATNAFSDLFMRLATDSDAAIAFVKGIVPSKASSAMDVSNITPIK